MMCVQSVKALATMVAITGLLSLTPRPTASDVPAEPPKLGSPGCPWPELSGQRLLDHQLGRVEFKNVAVRDLASSLVYAYGVPLSFIEDSPSTKVTVILPSCTLHELLDRIVAEHSGYRYGFIGSHLVLFSRDPKWQTRVNHLDLPTEPRSTAIADLVLGLQRLVPSLAQLRWAGVHIVGNPDRVIYTDLVHWSESASVIELLAQLLGHRISAVFLVSTRGGPPPGFVDVTTVQHLFRDALEISAAKKTLQLGDAVQLKVVATLQNGSRQDISAASCGTTYMAASGAVRVSPDGVVTAMKPGEGAVFAMLDDSAINTIHFAILPTGPLPPGPPEAAQSGHH
jgi:hypothetical protein